MNNYVQNILKGQLLVFKGPITGVKMSISYKQKLLDRLNTVLFTHSHLYKYPFYLVPNINMHFHNISFAKK